MKITIYNLNFLKTLKNEKKIKQNKKIKTVKKIFQK